MSEKIKYVYTNGGTGNCFIIELENGDIIAMSVSSFKKGAEYSVTGTAFTFDGREKPVN